VSLWYQTARELDSALLIASRAPEFLAEFHKLPHKLPTNFLRTSLSGYQVHSTEQRASATQCEVQCCPVVHAHPRMAVQQAATRMYNKRIYSQQVRIAMMKPWECK
jgi:hypothetical protein